MSSKQRILIIDDSCDNVDFLNSVLINDYHVKVALNGNDGIRLSIEKPVPDLILLDIVLPDINGYDICKILKTGSKTKNIPIIFVTVKDEIVDEELGLRLGAVDYLSKPINPAIVKARIKTHLSLRNQNRILEQKVEERTASLIEINYEIIKRLGKAVEFKDNHTSNHVNRMSCYVELLVKKMGLSDEEIRKFFFATHMHDIGKIGIPDTILMKPGKLTKDEWQLMKKHSVFGAEILGEPTSEIIRLAKIISLTHHEKWDGTGYPYGLEKDEIPLCGRIVAIADVFDALISQRPYKAAWKFDEAVEYIKNNSGKHFDPELVTLFLDNINEVRNIFEEYNDRDMKYVHSSKYFDKTNFYKLMNNK